MRVNNVINSNYSQNKQNKPAFKMNVEFMNQDALDLARIWFKKDKLEKILPEIDAIKTENGHNIVTEVYGDAKALVLKFIGKAEGQVVDNVRIGQSCDSTFSPKDINYDTTMFDYLKPTLNGIKEALDYKIVKAPKGKMFGKGVDIKDLHQ